MQQISLHGLSLPGLPSLSPHLDGLTISVVSTRAQAEALRQDPTSVFLATNFGDAQGQADISTAGLGQIDPGPNSRPGYTENSINLRSDYAAKPLNLVTTESGNVGKAFVALALKGLLSSDEHERAPSGINIRAFAAMTDRFLKDLVYGWPTAETAEGRALLVANHYASQYPRAGQTAELAQLLQYILKTEDSSVFEPLLQQEASRARLAATFPRSLIAAASGLFTVIKEETPAGFHPPTYCGLTIKGCSATLCIVARPTLGIVSLFSGTPEAAGLNQERGLMDVASFLNRANIDAGSGPVHTWGGNFNRLGCGPRRFSPEECLRLANIVATEIASHY